MTDTNDHLRDLHKIKKSDVPMFVRPTEGKQAESFPDVKFIECDSPETAQKYASMICLFPKLVEALEMCVKWIEPVMDGFLLDEKSESRINLEKAKALLQESRQENEMIKLDDYHLGFDDGYKRAISDAAKVAVNTPLALGLIPSSFLRLSIADRIRTLLSKGTQ